MLLRLECAADGKAASVREGNIQQHQIRYMLPDSCQRRLLPGGCGHGKALALQKFRQGRNDGRIILDQKNLCHRFSPRSLRSSQSSRFISPRS